jgi:hypothetical protein
MELSVVVFFLKSKFCAWIVSAADSMINPVFMPSFADTSDNPRHKI